MEVVPRHECKHCQKEFYGNGEFCCPGCAAVFSFIQQVGLSEFYKLRADSKLLSPDELAADRPPSINWNDHTLSLTGGLSRLDLRVHGITCSACAWLLEKIPSFQTDIKSVRLNLGSAKMTVLYDSKVAAEKIVTVFQSLGYEVTPQKSKETSDRQRAASRAWMTRVAVSFASMLATMHVSLTLYAGLLHGMSGYLVGHLGIVLLFLSLPAVFYSALPFYKSALIGIRSRDINLDTMVSLSVISGFLWSTYNILINKNDYYFDAVTMLIFSLLAGRLIVHNIETKLGDQDFSLAWDPTGRLTTESIGSEILIKTGESFPCDGVVVTGTSSMNASFLTGEEDLVPISIGQDVFCGAVNMTAPLTIRVQNVGEDTKAGQILKKLVSVKKSKLLIQSRKLEKIIFASVFLIVAGLFIFGITSHTSQAVRIISILMVTCPCALGLAAPAVLTAAMNQAFKKGILIKDSEVFERINEIDTFVFDKTGTLTDPRMRIQTIDWNEATLRQFNLSRSELLKIIASSCQTSKHLAASAISALFPPLLSVEQLKKGSFLCTETHGQGLRVLWQGYELLIGKQEFVAPKANNEVLRKKSTGPEIFVTLNGAPLVHFTLEAGLKSDAKTVLTRLAKRFAVQILSGDHKSSVEKTAIELGITPNFIYSEQTPEMKLDHIESLVKNHKIMMIGDGINDSLAFRKSHVAVAMKGGGASLDYCDIYLTKPALSAISQLITASKNVRHAILNNFAWAVVYNAIGVGLVLNNRIGPVICAIMMPLSSVTVVGLAAARRYWK